MHPFDQTHLSRLFSSVRFLLNSLALVQYFHAQRFVRWQHALQAVLLAQVHLIGVRRLLAGTGSPCAVRGRQKQQGDNR